MARVRDLERRLEARTAPPPELMPITSPRVYDLPVTVSIASVMASGALRYCSVREVRQIATAVALSRGDALPGGAVPISYEGPMLELAKARAEGLTWRAALEKSGLEAPDDSEITHRARALRGELRGLWDGFEALLGPLKVVTNPVAHTNFIEYLRRLLI